MADETLDKIISYVVGADGSLSEARDEITTGLYSDPHAIAFSGGRAYVTDARLNKIISYAVGAGGVLGEARDEITAGLGRPRGIAFSGGRAYVAASRKIISYVVGADGSLSEARDEITAGLRGPYALAFSGGRAYVTDARLNKIISYAVGAGGVLGAVRDENEITFRPGGIAFSRGRAYVVEWASDAGGPFKKIISYAVGANGRLGVERDEITVGLDRPRGIAFSGGRAYVTDFAKIISYPLIQISPPVAPDAPRVVAQSGSEIEIAWNAVSGATHYKLYRATARGGSYAQIGGEISATRYLNDGLSDAFSANTFYYYQLVACNSVGCSERSDGLVALATLVAAPQSDSEISITWSAVAGATHYKLYRSRSDGSYTQIGGEITATGYLDGGLSVRTAYDYQLEVCNRVECSARSLEVSAITYGSLGAARDEITADLLGPRDIAFSGGRAYVVDSGKIISYAVGMSGSLSEVRDEITDDLFFPFGIAFSGGRVYVLGSSRDEERIISYAVGAGGVLGEGRDEITDLSNPRGIAFSGGRAYVLAYEKIISYPVGMSGSLGAGRDEITAGLDDPYAIAFSSGRVYVVDEGLSKIISYVVGADGSLSEARDEITAGLSSPQGIAFSGGRAYVTDLAKIISYAVGAGGVLGEGRDEITDLSNPRDIAFSGERAYVTDLTDPPPAKIISYPLIQTSPPIAPDAPRVVAQSESEIEIAWNAVLGATHYKLYRSETSGGMYDQIGGEISVTRYLNEDLSANTSYYYQLEACSGDECSGSSPKVSATTDPPPPPPPAAPTTAAQSDSMISITWSAVAGATYYKLYRSATGGGSYTQVGEDITGTVYVDSNLSADTPYYYQLESCNDSGCSGSSPEVSAAIASPLGAGRDEIATDLLMPAVIAFSGGRVYVADDLFQKIVSYAAGADGSLGEARDEITGLVPREIAFSGGRAYVTYSGLDKIISYPVKEDGSLGEGRDEVIGLRTPYAITFSGGRAYVADFSLRKIISYAVGADGRLGAKRNEITAGRSPKDIAFSGGRAYVTDTNLKKIISYAVGAGGVLGEARDEITTGLAQPRAIAFSGGRVYVTDTGLNKIISYAVGTDGNLGEGRDEVTAGLLAFSSGRAYVIESKKIISYAVGTDGSLGERRDEIRIGESDQRDIAFSGGRAYVVEGNSFRAAGLKKIISYAVGVGGSLGEARDEIVESYGTALAFSGGRAYVIESNKIISYAVGTDGSLGEGRDEVTTGLRSLGGIAFSGGRAYVIDFNEIISYAVGTDGSLGERRDEITAGLVVPFHIAFSGGRAYVIESNKIISYLVGVGGSLGAARDEITPTVSPGDIAFSRGRAYVMEWASSASGRSKKIISYAVGANGRLGAERDEITVGLLRPRGIAFSGGRAYVMDFGKIISYPLIQIWPPVAPDAPRVVAQSESGIEIAWNAVLGATHYKLYRATTRGGSYTQIGGEIFATRYLNDGLSDAFSANTFYYYQLVACNSVGCSKRSDGLAALATLVAATQSDSEISITWSAVAGATHYKLYRSTSDGSYTQIGGKITAIGYLDSGLSVKTAYHYQLEVCNRGRVFGAVT